MAGITDEVYREAERGAASDDPRTAIHESIRGFLEAFVEHRRLWRCLIEGAFTNAEVVEMPAAVSRTERGVRSINRAASRASSRFSCRLIADCVRPIACAARVKLLSSAISEKARTASMSRAGE